MAIRTGAPSSRRHPNASLEVAISPQPELLLLELNRPQGVPARAPQRRLSPALGDPPGENDAHFRAIFNRAPIGICRIGMDGRILDANPKLQLMLGYSGDEFKTLTSLDITYPDDREQTRALYAALLDGGDHHDIREKRYLMKGGGVFWGALTTALVRQADGIPLYWVSMIEDINERKLAQDELRHKAQHDALTGLPNRHQLFTELGLVVGRTRRDGDGVGLMMIDLDGFKAVNDTHGHQAGDELLQQVSQRFRYALRSSDTLARMGGDEFAVVFPATGREGAEATARKLLRVLEPQFEIGGCLLSIGASMGIAIRTDGTDTAELIRQADQAMYTAKRAGGGFKISDAT